MIPVPPADDHNKIEELKKSLYSRTAPDVRTRRKLRFNDAESEVRKSWERPSEDAVETPLNKNYEDHSMSFFTKLLIGSVIFCAAAIGIGAYLFLNGSNLISANNIAIVISGPVSVPGGSPVSFDINVVNNNNVDLQLADLSVSFPDGATDPTDPTQVLRSYTHLLGDIPSGGTVKQTVGAILFGEENLQKEITATVTYKVKGSSSIFTKTQTYDVLINSSPINLTVAGFNQITSGQAFDLAVSIQSNSQQTLKNVLMKASYPFGYSFASADLKPLSDNSTWKVGDIPPGGKRTITIHGTLTGEDSDTRVFHFAVGAQSSTAPSAIGTEYMAVEQDLSIQKPFISLNVPIDDDQSAGDHVGQFNQAERVQINWFNNLPVPVSNMQITAQLSGSAYDKTSVQPDLGYFQSADNQIVWSQQTNPELASVAAGANGSVSFTIFPRDTSTASNQVVNPTISLEVGVSGNRAQETGVSGSLTSAVTRTIKVSPNVSLTGRIVRTAGPFANTGLIPPKVEQPTTYTVVWTVDNTTSSVANAQVTATLPPYVKWLGAVSPSTENMTYDKNSGLVTWNIGNVGTYTVGSGHRREADFQISFTPSINQVDQSPTLVNQSTLTGTDSFTGVSLQSQQDYLTTRFSTDPAYKDGAETVVK